MTTLFLKFLTFITPCFSQAISFFWRLSSQMMEDLVALASPFAFMTLNEPLCNLPTFENRLSGLLSWGNVEF